MNSKKKSKLKLAQDEAQAAINKTNKKIEELGEYSNSLCLELNRIQELFDEIRNIPNDKKLECEKLKKIRLKWKQQAEKIESDYRAAAVKMQGQVRLVWEQELQWLHLAPQQRWELQLLLVLLLPALLFLH